MTKREGEARRWFRQARRDLESAELNAEHGRHEVACFLAQQAGEKALKAILYAQGESPVLGHSLVELVTRASRHVAPLGEIREAAKQLDGYYVTARYPNSFAGETAPVDFFEAGDAQRALAASHEIVAAVARHLPTAATSGE